MTRTPRRATAILTADGERQSPCGPNLPYGIDRQRRQFNPAGRYRVRIYVGSFSTLREAIRARDLAIAAVSLPPVEIDSTFRTDLHDACRSTLTAADPLTKAVLRAQRTPGGLYALRISPHWHQALRRALVTLAALVEGDPLERHYREQSARLLAAVKGEAPGQTSRPPCAAVKRRRHNKQRADQPDLPWPVFSGGQEKWRAGTHTG